MLRKLVNLHSVRSVRLVSYLSARHFGRNSLFTLSKRLEAPAEASNTSTYLSNRTFAQSPCFPNKAVFEEVCSETLDSLTDHFEELIESTDVLSGADVNYSDGVLTVQFGDPHGTYVINRQSPNEQIWLSSPTSGPKRYDYIEGSWIYRHDGVSLHELLSKEISIIVKKDIDFKQCSHSGKK
ncbi:frataxin homolog, mitochondrial [Thrips palmi]|uniref:ferroxidase n=1 Tax=Thrips palmi TaxID=161013 RepID=A0A6P9A3H2_THRPL|nr:frataxin homolog, mitochondrial [Thrips palmi]